MVSCIVSSFLAFFILFKKQSVTDIYPSIKQFLTREKKSPYILPLHNHNIQLPLLEELYIDKEEMIEYEQINVENQYRVKMYVAIERIL
jgi:hypothetical protein